MALSQRIPEFTPAEGLGIGKPIPLRRMPAPVPTGFRAGGGLDEIVETIRANRAVAVDSAAGAGKSTKLPRVVADALGMLVIHVVPSVFIAKELYAYVSTLGGEVSLVTLVEHEWPISGVAIATAAVIQAKFLQAGKLELPKCALLHDECHRADAWTYLLGKQWGTIKGVEKYITASATNGSRDYRKVETKGTITTETYPAKYRDEKWEVFGNAGLPWEVSGLTGNALIWEDDAHRAQGLLEDYSKAGIEVFRLHSRMSEQAFDTAMYSLRGEALTVLVADSSFRDSMTWPLNHIIDSGRVIVRTVEAGLPRMYVRDAYKFEIYQGSARGGRVQGQHVYVHVPDMNFQSIRVTLEPVEIEAVALVSRMLNTMVPMEALDAVMAEGRVPRDLAAALRDTQPLALLKDTQTTVLASGGYKRTPSPVVLHERFVAEPGSDYVHRGMSADRANARDFTATSESDHLSQSTAPTSVSDVFGDAGQWVVDALSRSEALEVGKYYFSPSVDASRVASPALPEGWRSAMRVFSDTHGKYGPGSVAPETRSVAIAALMQRFNSLSCELAALRSGTADASKLAVGRSAEGVRAWLSSYLEKATALQVEQRRIIPVLEKLAEEFVTYERLPDDCMREHENMMAMAMLEQVRAIPTSGYSAQQAAEAARNSFVPPVHLLPQEVEMLPVVAAPAQYVEMASRGRTARPMPIMVRDKKKKISLFDVAFGVSKGQLDRRAARKERGDHDW